MGRGFHAVAGVPPRTPRPSRNGCDLNGDGLLDLVLAEGKAAKTGVRLHFYFNTGTASQPNLASESTVFIAPQPVAGVANEEAPYPRLCDIDGDGDLDLFMGFKGDGVPIELTAPVAFLSHARMADPFATGILESLTRQGAISPLYTYMKIVTLSEALASSKIGRDCPNEAIDHRMHNRGALERYGRWRLVSKGPDRVYLSMSFPYPLRDSDIPDDPTNGTVSFGNILRTQKQ